MTAEPSPVPTPGPSSGPTAIPSSPAAQSAPLLSGTVTFLFRDIEGSTERWERQPEAMRAALAALRALGEHW